MTKKLVILLIILLLYSLSHSESVPETEIVNLTKSFLNNIQNNKKNPLINSIFSKVKLKHLTKKNIMQLSDDLIMEKISISRYILTITGHNLYKFINNKFKLLKFKFINKIGTEYIASDKIIKTRFYYLKYKISYQKDDKTFKDKIIEIDIIQENGQYKIFGFIL